MKKFLVVAGLIYFSFGISTVYAEECTSEMLSTYNSKANAVSLTYEQEYENSYNLYVSGISSGIRVEGTVGGSIFDNGYVTSWFGGETFNLDIIVADGSDCAMQTIKTISITPPYVELGSWSDDENDEQEPVVEPSDPEPTSEPDSISEPDPTPDPDPVPSPEQEVTEDEIIEPDQDEETSNTNNDEEDISNDSTTEDSSDDNSDTAEEVEENPNDIIEYDKSEEKDNIVYNILDFINKQKFILISLILLGSLTILYLKRKDTKK